MPGPASAGVEDEEEQVPPAGQLAISELDSSMPGPASAGVEDEEEQVPPAGQLAISELECPICYALLCKPISLPCGHTICRSCLRRSLASQRKCPECRAPCHINLDQHENVLLAGIASRLWPDVYEARLRECKAIEESWSLQLPIFFYNEIMLPGEILRLHLFEPRYRLMMKRIMASSRRFAYVPRVGGHMTSRGDIALIAEITECEFLSDGRSLLEAKLVGRHQIKEEYVEDGTQGLHYCSLEPLKDEPLTPEDESAANTLLEEIKPFASSLLVAGRGLESGGSIPQDLELASFFIAGLLPVPASVKHPFLTGRNTLERLRIIANVCSRMRS
jgi:Lon protease-like protein